MSLKQEVFERINPYAHGTRLRNKEDFFPKGFTAQELEQVYYRLTAGRVQGYLILESPTFEQVDDYWNPGEQEVEASFIMEAIVVDKFARTERRMAALSRVLGKHMNTQAQDGEVISPQAPIVGKPKKSGSFAYVTVQIPFSDGQTVSIVFHSPEGDKKKIGPDDQIIAFRWLLNKRDITHVVAPEGGQEVTLETVGKRMAQLVIKNHARFVATQKDAVEEQRRLDELKAQAATLDAENQALAEQATANETQRATLNAQVNSTQAKIEKQKAYNSKLQAEIDALKATKAAKVELAATSGEKSAGGSKKIVVHPMMTDGTYKNWKKTGAKIGRAANGWDVFIDDRMEKIEYVLMTSYDMVRGGFSSEDEARAWAMANKANKNGYFIKGRSSGDYEVDMDGKLIDGSTAAGLSANEEAVLRDLDVDRTGIDAIAKEGGYGAIVADEEKQLRLQDTLDSAFGFRIVQVRNALRELGWTGGENATALQKNSMTLGHGVKAVGAGRNVVAVEFILSGGGKAAQRFQDALDMTNADLAAKIDSAAQDDPEQKQGPDFEEMVATAARWKGATLQVAKIVKDNKKKALALSRMTTKGDLDAYLMARYEIDETTARSVSNTLTQRNTPADMTASLDEFLNQAWAELALPDDPIDDIVAQDPWAWPAEKVKALNNETFNAVYDRLEDQNYHTENVILMAKRRGTPEHIARAEDLLSRQQAAGGLSMAMAEERYKLMDDIAASTGDQGKPELAPETATPALAPAAQQTGNPAKRAAKILYHHGLEKRVMGEKDFIVRIVPRQEGPNLIIEKAGASLTIAHLERRNGKVVPDQALTFAIEGDRLQIERTVVQGPTGLIRGKDLAIAQVFTKELIDQGLARSGVLKEGRGILDAQEKAAQDTTGLDVSKLSVGDTVYFEMPSGWKAGNYRGPIDAETSVVVYDGGRQMSIKNAELRLEMPGDAKTPHFSTVIPAGWSEKPGQNDGVEYVDGKGNSVTIDTPSNGGSSYQVASWKGEVMNGVRSAGTAVEAGEVATVFMRELEAMKASDDNDNAYIDRKIARQSVAVKNNVQALRPFTASVQMKVIADALNAEEGDWWAEKLAEYAGRIQAMPKTYGQDGKGDDAMVYLHYFKGGSDWYITEKDMGSEQMQAFGYTILNGDKQNAETGYINIDELTRAGVELDLHWTPKTLREVKGGKDVEPEPAPRKSPAQEMSEAVESYDLMVDNVSDTGVIFSKNGKTAEIRHENGGFRVYYGNEVTDRYVVAEDAMKDAFGVNARFFDPEPAPREVVSPEKDDSKHPALAMLENILSGAYDNDLASLEAQFESALTELEKAGLDEANMDLIEQVSDYYTARLNAKAKEVA
jgi:hypothetical protein